MRHDSFFLFELGLRVTMNNDAKYFLKVNSQKIKSSRKHDLVVKDSQNLYLLLFDLLNGKFIMAHLLNQLFHTHRFSIFKFRGNKQRCRSN